MPHELQGWHKTAHIPVEKQQWSGATDKKRTMKNNENGALCWGGVSWADETISYHILMPWQTEPITTTVGWSEAWTFVWLTDLYWDGAGAPVMSFACEGANSIEGPYTWDGTSGWLKRWTQSGSAKQVAGYEEHAIAVSSVNGVSLAFREHDDDLFPDHNRVYYSDAATPATKYDMDTDPHQQWSTIMDVKHKFGDDTVMLMMTGKPFSTASPANPRIRIKRSTNTGLTWSGTNYDLPAPWNRTTTDEYEPEQASLDWREGNTLAYGNGVVVCKPSNWVEYDTEIRWAWSDDDGLTWTTVTTTIAATLSYGAPSLQYTSWGTVVSPDGNTFAFVQNFLFLTGSPGCYVQVMHWDQGMGTWTDGDLVNMWGDLKLDVTGNDVTDIIHTAASVTNDGRVRVAYYNTQREILRRDYGYFAGGEDWRDYYECREYI